MHHPNLFLVTSFLFISCTSNNPGVRIDPGNFTRRPQISFQTIKAIPVPGGYERVALAQGSFGEWLAKITVKKDGLVYLFDGSLKKNQTAQFAVLDVPIGKKDLLLCADAVIRLRAEYLFHYKRYEEIFFKDNNGKSYAWEGSGNQQNFDNYLENVFSQCGTASLEKQLKPVNDWREMQPGDVFIKGGFPGHAMIVIDAAINTTGNKIFMLA